MVFDMIPQSPLFSIEDKTRAIENELNTYERRQRQIENEFAGALKQECAAELLAWIGDRIAKS